MRLLIAGIGNIFRGDDAFGCEVARILAERPLPEGVVVRDFGTRGFDLACALLDGYDGAILLDAAARGHPPGTLYVIEPERAGAPAPVDPHGLTPEHVLRLVESLGGEPPWLRVIGCEPAVLGDDVDGAMGLSEPVQAVVGEASRMAEDLATEFLNTGRVRESPSEALP
jgi:hydrogenase maturation protease